MAQSVKCLTVDLGSGLSLRVVSSSPVLGSKVVGMKSISKQNKTKVNKNKKKTIPYLDTFNNLTFLADL